MKVPATFLFLSCIQCLNFGGVRGDDITSSVTEESSTTRTNLATSSAAINTSPLEHCYGRCRLAPIVWPVPPQMWVWAHVMPTGEFTAATVIKFVNTAINYTSTSTLSNPLPPGVTPVPTNSLGTRIATVTWMGVDGHNHSTVLDFPNTFLDWGTAYKWDGMMKSTTMVGNATTPITLCLRPTDAVTVTLQSEPPRPTTQMSWVDYVTVGTGDTREDCGLDYFLGRVRGISFLGDNSALFPDHPALTSCEGGEGGLIDVEETVAWVTETMTSHFTGVPPPLPPPPPPSALFSPAQPAAAGTVGSAFAGGSIGQVTRVPTPPTPGVIASGSRLGPTPGAAAGTGPAITGGSGPVTTQALGNGGQEWFKTTSDGGKHQDGDGTLLSGSPLQVGQGPGGSKTSSATGPSSILRPSSSTDLGGGHGSGPSSNGGGIALRSRERFAAWQYAVLWAVATCSLLG